MHGWPKTMSHPVCDIVQETVSYFVHGGGGVMGMVYYSMTANHLIGWTVITFNVSLDKGVSPMYYRLLLNIYLQQKLRITWNPTSSKYFAICNYVKQRGGISEFYFCIYIACLLNEQVEK